MNIKINTNAVLAAAGEIDQENTRMHDQLQSVQSAVQRLNKAWDGKGADDAQNAFRRICDQYEKDRYNIVASLTGFMRAQVGESYERTEAAVSDAVAAFK